MKIQPVFLSSVYRQRLSLRNHICVHWERPGVRANFQRHDQKHNTLKFSRVTVFCTTEGTLLAAAGLWFWSHAKIWRWHRKLLKIMKKGQIHIPLFILSKNKVCPAQTSLVAVFLTFVPTLHCSAQFVFTSRDEIWWTWSSSWDVTAQPSRHRAFQRACLQARLSQLSRAWDSTRYLWRPIDANKPNAGWSQGVKPNSTTPKQNEMQVYFPSTHLTLRHHCMSKYVFYKTSKYGGHVKRRITRSFLCESIFLKKSPESASQVPGHEKVSIFLFSGNMNWGYNNFIAYYCDSIKHHINLRTKKPEILYSTPCISVALCRGWCKRLVNINRGAGDTVLQLCHIQAPEGKNFPRSQKRNTMRETVLFSRKAVKSWLLELKQVCLVKIFQHKMNSLEGGGCSETSSISGSEMYSKPWTHRQN